MYRSQFGLAPCTTANGCFKKVNQTGVQGSYPRTDSRVGSRDLARRRHDLGDLPELQNRARRSQFEQLANLAATVDTAALLGASAISNSYGGSEYSSEVTDQSHFNHRGHAITASSGDAGYGVEFPAASQYVTAAGGTSLSMASSTVRGWTGTAWSGAGSGCSAYIQKPSWQTDSGCARRTVADVAAVADPNTGVAVYDSLSYQGLSGWLVFGASHPRFASLRLKYDTVQVSNLTS